MFIGASVYLFDFSTRRRRGAEALEILRGREASHKKQGTGMGERCGRNFALTSTAQPNVRFLPRNPYKSLTKTLQKQEKHLWDI